MAETTIPTAESVVISRADAKAAGMKRYFTGKSCKQGHIAERAVVNGGCIVCWKLRYDAWRTANPEKGRESSAAWYAANTERVRANWAAYYANNHDAMLQRAKGYREENIELVKAREAAYRAANAEKLKEKSKIYNKIYRLRPDVKERERRWHAAYYLENKGRINAYGKEWSLMNITRVRVNGSLYREINRDRLLEAGRLWRKSNREKISAYGSARRARERAAPGSHTAADVRWIYAAQKGKCACCRIRVRKDRQVDHIISLARGGSNFRSNLQILCASCNRRKNARDPIEFMQAHGYLL
jgi:5-methylcytosine-specific restriction endonuclease McrA